MTNMAFASCAQGYLLHDKTRRVNLPVRPRTWITECGYLFRVFGELLSENRVMLILIMPLIALLTPNELRVSRIIPDAHEFSLGVDFAESYRLSRNYIDRLLIRLRLLTRSA